MKTNRPKTLLIFLTALITASLALSACTQSTTNLPPTSEPAAELTLESLPESAAVELTDGLGKTITIDGPAQRIISLAPSNTEILFALNAGSQVVGRDAFSDYPEAATGLPDIGGGFGELNVEVIVSLDSDLVLAADLTPPEQIQQLEDLGLVVFALLNPTDFNGLYENLETIGKLTGRISESQALIESLQARVSAVTEKVAETSEKPLVFYELDSTDPDAPWTSGPGTFIDTLIAQAGGQNLGGSLEGAWAQISIETLLTESPDIIILGDYTWGGVTPEAVAARSGWDALEAVANGQVYTFDDNLVSRPGPRLVDGLEEMARLLHPELFE